MRTTRTEPEPQNGSGSTKGGSLPKSLDPTDNLRNLLVSAENWVGSALIALGGGNEHEMRWRAGKAREILEVVCADDAPPAPRDEAIRLKDERIAELLRLNAALREELHPAQAVGAAIFDALSAGNRLLSEHIRNAP